MNITIIPNSQQTSKISNEGAIVEKKILGFQQDKGFLKPYSNIFYWSHLKTDYGSIISEHPHIGFEIIIYVLKGTVEILDNVNGKRSKLKEGDLQVMKTGKGMKHLEKLNSHSEFIEIWLDPNFDKFKKTEPALSKSQSTSFPVSIGPGKNIKTLAGKEAPIHLESEDVFIQLMELSPMDHHFPLHENTVMSGYLLEGEIITGTRRIRQGDFFSIQDTQTIEIQVIHDTKLFTVLSPVKPAYQTYAELYL